MSAQRKRPLSVRAILQQPGAQKLAKAAPQVPQAKRNGASQVDQLWEQMHLAESTGSPPPAPTPTSRDKVPTKVPESQLWQEMREAEAAAQMSRIAEPRHPSTSSRSKSKRWNVRNLTHERESFEKRYDLRGLRRELETAQARESTEEHRFAVLRLEFFKQKSLIDDEPGEGENWQAVREAAADLVENTQQALQQAEELQAQIRRNAAQLAPGAEMMRSRVDLQEAHETIVQLRKQLTTAERKKEAARSLVLIQNEMDQLEKETVKRRPRCSQIEEKIRKFEVHALFAELAEAEAKAESLPQVVLHVKPSKELRQLAGQQLWLKEVLGQLETEWAFHFQVDREGDQHGLTLPLLPFMMALRARYPGSDPVLLALVSPAQAVSKYIQVHLSSAQIVQRYSKTPPEAVPSAIELIRSLLGFNNKVLLMPAVQRLMHKALQSRAVEVPDDLQGTLRKYQAQGFRWLASNAENGIGSLLADDMGLGKTLQSAVLLQYLRDQGHITEEQPALVVVPFSVLRNWHAELERWTPSLKTQMYHGKDRYLEGGGEVLITTYRMVQTDLEKLCSGSRFACIILDEAQYIKNAQSLTAKAIKQLATECGSGCARVALTGTPIENRLGELFSIFEFLNPGFLGSKEEFAKNFERPLQKEENHEAVLARFRGMLGPFMLRRLKEDKAIAPELPEKVEYEYVVEMTKEQSELYMRWTRHLLEQVQHGGAAPTSDVPEAAPRSALDRRRAVFTLLHRLQQVVNHPAAMPLEHQLEEHSRDPSKSGKMTRLVELLSNIWEDPEQKVLIFTQYRDTQQLLAEVLQREFADLRPLLFHGGLSSDERQQAMNDFAADANCRVLILTLKAGGIGLNLTAASHVVHFDRCWNPAKEAQATDRAHRIGQHRTVLVHRFTTVGTFEERLAYIVAEKKSLADRTISDSSGSQGDVTQAVATLSDSQLKQLFNLTTR